MVAGGDIHVMSYTVNAWNGVNYYDVSMLPLHDVLYISVLAKEMQNC
jgi:hypothetical protein